MMILKFLVFVFAYTSFSVGYAVSSPDVLALWDRAVGAVKFQQQEAITELNEQLKGQVAPPDFLSVHQPTKYGCESSSDYQKRILIPELLCSVGWGNTLFLMSNITIFQQYFKTSTKLSPCQRHYITKDYLVQHFTSIEAAAEKGQLGAVLSFLHYDNSSLESHWNFINGFFRYCQNEGYTNFTKHVFDNSHIFFKGERNQFLKSLQGKCFIAALRKCQFSINPEQEIRNFEKFHLNQENMDEIYQNLMDALYVALAKNQSYKAMDLIVDCDSWPQPSIDAKNSAQQAINANFQELLVCGQYSAAKDALSRETNRPDKGILHIFLAKSAQNGEWYAVDSVLTNMYDESLPVPQALTDDLFVCATAYDNDQYFGLLTGENTFAVLTGENWAYEPPTSAAFDRGLLETIKFRSQARFDHLLDTYAEKLSEEGLREALEQAGKPAKNSTPLFYIDYYFLKENHYQERLKRKLGIPTYMEHVFTSNSVISSLVIPDLDVPAFSFPTVDLSSLLVPQEINLFTPTEKNEQNLPEQLNDNNSSTQKE